MSAPESVAAIAWRSRRRQRVVTTWSAAVAAMGVVTWVAMPVRDGAGTVAAEPDIVMSAMAFNRGGGFPRRDVVPAGVTRVAEQRPDVAAAPHIALGQKLRIQRRFVEAAEAFRQATQADPTDASSWADLADCQAAAGGGDLGRGRDAIDKALAIDPHHRKALWLRASLQLQQREYVAAAATWRQLQTLVAGDSPDARVIAANIAEADELAAARRGAG